MGGRFVSHFAEQGHLLLEGVGAGGVGRERAAGKLLDRDAHPPGASELEYFPAGAFVERRRSGALRRRDPGKAAVH